MDDLYISLHNPRDLRRRILEASKVVIFNLKEYQNLQNIRKKKTVLLQSLKNQIKELVLLVEKLSVLLPEKDFSAETADLLSSHDPNPIGTQSEIHHDMDAIPDIATIHESSDDSKIIPEDDVEMLAEQNSQQTPDKPKEQPSEKPIADAAAVETKAKESISKDVKDLGKLEGALDKIEERLNLLK